MTCFTLACSDIVTNVASDAIFVVVVLSLVWLLNKVIHRSRLDRARQFFGFSENMPAIYVSGFEHPGVKTKRVVNALEYDDAVVLSLFLRTLADAGAIGKIADFLAGLIGLASTPSQPGIVVSPLNVVTEPPHGESIIVIGGPVSNQLSKYYMSGKPRFRFDEKSGKYQESHETGYRDIEPSNGTAVIEKMLVSQQVVILLHGFGEEETGRAVHHLISNWKTLHRQFGTRDFAIRV